MDKNQEDLGALLTRIFEDGIVDPSEREELRLFWIKRGMTVSQVRQVVDQFLAHEWEGIMKDGVVTPEERIRLKTVVEGLNLPEAALSAEVQAVLEGGHDPEG